MVYQQVGQSGQNTENEREEGIWQVQFFWLVNRKVMPQCLVVLHSLIRHSMAIGQAWLQLLEDG